MDKPIVLCDGAAMRQAGQPIEIVFAADDGYCQHLAVAMLSLAQNNRANRIHVTVVSRGIGAANQRKLRDMLAPYSGLSLDFLTLDRGLVEHLPTKIHLTVETYFRLFLPDILPASLDRVLYLDADLVVLGDLDELWRTPMGAAPVAAAREPFGDTIERLSLPADALVFNAGVLLMNLSVWRKEGLRARCLDYVADNEALLQYCDQDALNAVLVGRVKPISYAWNFGSRTRYQDLAPLGITFAEYREMNARPRIVHYSSPRKPWRYRDDAPRERYYLRYLRKTPWRGVGQPDRTVEQMVRRHLGPRLGPTIRRALNTIAGRAPGGG